MSEFNTPAPARGESILEQTARQMGNPGYTTKAGTTFPRQIHHNARVMARATMIMAVAKAHDLDIITAGQRVDLRCNWDEIAELTRADVEARAAHASWGRK
jgi:hypothetical protein